MRKTFLLISILAVSIAASAAVVTPERAMQVAQSFVPVQKTSKKNAPGVAATPTSQIVYTHYMPKSGRPAIYVVNIGNAFAIVSADDVAHPILGYNYSKSWPTDGNIPPQVKAFFDDLAQQMEAAAEHPQDTETAAEWFNPRMKKSTKLTQTNNLPDSVGPLLTTTWDQGQYYNSLCPEDQNGPDGHAVTGCVATAMAQIIAYWGKQDPIQTRGIHSYESDYGTLTVNYDTTTYDFAHMPDELTSTSTPQEVNAVAKLMYHCGVAVNMGYGAGASNAGEEDARTSLVNHFGFSAEMGYANKQMYSRNEWIDSLRANIFRQEPILYYGWNFSVGHAFICDGYKQNDYFHFNFGWNGDCDGWYLTSAINAGIGFSSCSSAIMGIRPKNNQEALVCQMTRGLCVEEFTILNATDLYDLREGNSYLTTKKLDGTRIQMNLVPENAMDQLVLDFIDFGKEQSVVVYDGINEDSLVRVIETRNIDDWNTITYKTWFYEGLPSDSIFQNMAGIDLSPIVSTRHGFTIVVYGYGGMSEGFHMRVNNALSCRMVSNLTADENAEGTQISWTGNGSAAQWQIKVGNLIYNCADTRYQISGLLPDSSYIIQVRSVCEENEYSTWNTIVVNKRVYWTDIVKSEPCGYALDGDTIHITSAEGLAWVAHCLDSLRGNDVNYLSYSSHILSIERDVNLEGFLWSPIRDWNGCIEGHGHKISNMIVNSSSYGGLFSFCHGKIRNVGIIESKVNAVNSAGALLGCAQNSHIMNCWAYNNKILSGNGQCGGLIGNVWDSQIINCYCYGDVYAQFGYGGMFGNCSNSDIKNCVIGIIQSDDRTPISGEYGLFTEEVHGGSFSNCYANVGLAKNLLNLIGDDEYDLLIKRAYFFGNVYNYDVIENIAAFNSSKDTMGILLVDTAINYTLGDNMDVITALNDLIVAYNSSEYRLWVRDKMTHLPILGDYYEVTCPNVSNIVAESIPYRDGFAVALSWHENGEAVEWQIKYNIKHAPEDSATIINTHVARDTLEGLKLGSEYVFYIRPLCVGQDTVGWGEPYNFFVNKILWIDMVSSCPEGYVEDAKGNVTISSPEGLAWLAKNGFNNRADTIFIESDLNMEAYGWTPIGNYEFRGIVEGNNHLISNVYCCNNMSDNS